MGYEEPKSKNFVLPGAASPTSGVIMVGDATLRMQLLKDLPRGKPVRLPHPARASFGIRADLKADHEQI
jgi:hypothetical protein